MRIKLNTTLAGPQGSHHAGAVIDVEEKQGKELIDGKYAILYVEPPKAKAPAKAKPEAKQEEKKPEAEGAPQAQAAAEPAKKGKK